MSTVRELLAKNMKRYRQILGWSQADLAEKVGCSTTLIGNIEIQKRFPSAENLDRIAQALKITSSDLFAETETSSINNLINKYELKSLLENKINKVINDVFQQ